MLFNRQPKLFSSFTVNLGPLYVERVIDRLLTKEGVSDVVRMTATDRYEHYISYLKDGIAKSTRKQYTLTQLFMGHFYQQQAILSNREESRQHFLEKALCHYQCYLDLPAFPNEGRYYAQWQAGVLQDQLGYPWRLAECALHAATTIDPLRGEAHRYITLHYVRQRDWMTAYRYSQKAIEQFFDHNPIANRYWQVNFEAYNWSLLHTHLSICYKLGSINEAIATYDRMLRYELEHLHEFKNSDIRQIHSLQKIFLQPKERIVGSPLPISA